nr:hypothetical protein [Tanacetum cinerariifolium]
MTSLTFMCELAYQIVQHNLEEKQLEEEQAAKAQNWKLPVCYDDDDDEESSNSLEDNIISELPSYFAVILTEPIDSLSMGDEHLDTVPATKSDEFIKKGLCLNLQKSTKFGQYLHKERIVLKFAKINKIRTISTQGQKPQRKAGSGSKFSSNNFTVKLNLSKFQV